MGNVTQSIVFMMLLVCFLSLYFDIYAFSFIMISFETSSIQKTFCQHNLVSEVVNEDFLVDDKSHSENFFIHVYPIDNAILEWMHTCSFEHTSMFNNCNCTNMFVLSEFPFDKSGRPHHYQYFTLLPNYFGAMSVSFMWS